MVDRLIFTFVIPLLALLVGVWFGRAVRPLDEDARKQGFREGLEFAAWVCDGQADICPTAIGWTWSNAARQIAEKLRSLL